MDADIFSIYQSDFYKIIDFRCRCTNCITSKPEYSDSFCISFVRKGNFLFNVFRNSLDAYNGCALVSKPSYEHTVTHTHSVPDQCTIFQFNFNFYRELTDQYDAKGFFNNRDVHSTLVKTNAELEFLHYNIMKLAITNSATKLEIDQLVIEMIEKTIERICLSRPDRRINPRLKKNHLITIERAKEFITEEFTNDISLMDIARYCHISPFHFSRIFKTFTYTSPHQFLLSLRLKNAEVLLRNTALPVTDVAYTSGFNSIQYFTSAFRRKYNCSPSKFTIKRLTA